MSTKAGTGGMKREARDNQTGAAPVSARGEPRCGKQLGDKSNAVPSLVRTSLAGVGAERQMGAGERCKEGKTGRRLVVEMPECAEIETDPTIQAGGC